MKWKIGLEGCILYCFWENLQKQPLEVFIKKAVLKKFAISTGKHLCWILFWIKSQVFLEKDTQVFWRTPILKNICERQFLNKCLMLLMSFCNGVVEFVYIRQGKTFIFMSPQKTSFWHFSVCNFQSMKSSVELNSLLSKFFCYITWFVNHLIRRNTGRQILLFFQNNSLAV